MTIMMGRKMGIELWVCSSPHILDHCSLKKISVVVVEHPILDDDANVMEEIM